MELVREGATLRVVGQVDGRTTSELRDALAAQLREEPGDVVLDLAAVEAVDLTALRMIAVASRSAMLAGHHLLLRGASPVVRRLLHLSHLRGLIDFEDQVAV
ncbi:STAS domain-containing protein [Nocardioides terrisoli]|uniref:STAS domain-containing protein n=1 Tax=Nocardioides terrisoli TaxID=3388267 RepID=UPI00287B8923|nr:STAS domain-containing protein [Nocardioides marmorisolisilvae]